MKRAVHHSAVWLIVPLWAMFVGAFLGRVAILIHHNHFFIAHAQRTEGLVQQKFEQRLDRFSSEKIYALRYVYAAGGVQGRILSQVERQTYERTKVGGRLPVLYLPQDPRQHLIDYPWEKAAEAWMPLDDFVVAMMVFVPGIFIIGYFAIRNRIHARLIANGAHAWGEVTALKKTHTRHGSHTYLTFRFTAANGRQIEGRSDTLPESTHWQAGDPIQVRYDPKKPQYFAVDLVHPVDMLDDDPAPAPFYQTIWA